MNASPFTTKSNVEAVGPKPLLSAYNKRNIRSTKIAMIEVTTQPEAATMPAEYALAASGTLRLALVINLASFVAPEDADAFRHLRGSEAFATAIRNLGPHAPFRVDDEQATVEQAGYDLRIFRSRLLYNHFFPTYRVGWDAGMRERLLHAGCTDTRRWQRWTPRLRLTRNGLATITLDLGLDHMPLLRCTEQVLEIADRAADCGPQDQWALGILMLQAFLDAIDRQISVEIHGRARVVHFLETSRVKHTLRLDRYVIYALREIRYSGELVSAGTLKSSFAPTLAAFMEGALVERDGVRRYPRYELEKAQTLVAGDTSSWSEELCLFTGESALLYFPLVGQSMAYVGGPRGLDAAAYATYWNGIMRGVEHVVALRSEIQQTERRTTDLLSSVPGLTRKVTDGHLSAGDHTMIDQLGSSLSDIFDNLPELRSMAISANAFRADYVRHKFDQLMDELAIADTLELVHTNVEQLNFFLSYYNDMRLQWQGQRTNSLAAVLGVIVTFMAISSFLADTFNVVDGLGSHRPVLASLGIAVCGLAILALSIYSVRKRLARRTKGGPR